MSTPVGVIKRLNGKVSYITKHPDFDSFGYPFSEEIQKAEKNLHDSVSSRETVESNIPSSREFRDAWTDDNPEDTIGINLSRAKNVQLYRLRKRREPALSEQDIEYMRGIEVEDSTGDPSVKNAAAAEKQRLRDITNPLKELDPQNIAQIEALWPAEFEKFYIGTPDADLMDGE